VTALARLAGLIADMTDGEQSELAHRFRTPLALIVGHAELLQRRGDDASRERATLILEAAEELGRAVDELFEREATAPE
jgi:signal transduction histidine kinase